MPTYEALVTLRVKTVVPHDNPAWVLGLEDGLKAGRYEFVEVAKPFQGESPCEQHGEPK